MKDFFKYTLATVAGIVLACIVLFFVGTAILLNMAASSSSEAKVEPGTVFKLDLSGMLYDHTTRNSLSVVLGDDFAATGLDDVLASIRKAKDNDRICGIYLRPETTAGYASLKEIRDALVDFKQSGKFIVAYADFYTQRMYYLASVADHLLLNPEGMIEWKGLAARPVFYKDLLKKIGVEMQIFKVGTYKSAVEPYTTTDVSPANREQLEAYMNSVWGQMTADIAASRPITEQALNEAADRMMALRPAEETVSRCLADTLIYKSDVKAYLKRLVGKDEDDSLPMLDLAEMINVTRNEPKDKSGQIIAVYYAEGEIVSEASSLLPLLSGTEPNIQANKVVSDLNKLRDDRDVKAVVLRVNSPGGVAFSAEQIWHAVEQLKEEKPVIVSMGNYAASGGYYISCNADVIVAQPTTLTGSIGIYGMFPNIKGLNDLLGLHYSVVKTHELADFENYNRPMNQAERAVMQGYIERGYELFLKRCCDGRGMSRDEMDRIAQGRVWTGSMAKELGLVDELGGLDRAIELAKQMADVEAYTLMSYPVGKGLVEQVSQLLGTELHARTSNPLTLIRQQMEAWGRADLRESVQAHLPFELNMN